MNISAETNGPMIRKAFIDRFTMPRDVFWARHADSAAEMFPQDFNAMFLWDKLDVDASGFETVSFAKALALLRSLPDDVLLMSENEDNPNGCGIRIGGTEQKGCVARANAAELAERIEFEWYESWRLFAQDMYLAETVLPDDLYVFDESMEHVIVFTHENDNWESELTDPIKSAESRFCMMCDFPSVR